MDSERPDPVAQPVVRRMPLGRTRRRLSFERRLRAWAAASALPALLLLAMRCRDAGLSWLLTAAWVAAAGLVWWIAASFFLESVVRPLQTLSNIVASLREEDFAFRARGARRGDAMGDLALELNALANDLQRQRNSAMDALTLADRVMTSMPSPVLAFDATGRLQLLNAATEREFHMPRSAALGRSVSQLKLLALFERRDQETYLPEEDGRAAHEGANTRWFVRRSIFRLHGSPHTLFVLSDVAPALREEERLAWQRLIRVLGHEINNSLTPIKSIASMLRSRPLKLAPEVHTTQDLDDLRRGLLVIEDRADSLNRFLQAYQQLSRLPQPVVQRIDLRALVNRTVPLETRVRVSVAPSPEVTLQGDPDQLQQVLINLLKNAADAALEPEANHRNPQVTLRWKPEADAVLLQVIDSGPGLANPDNLFVPFYTTKPQGAGIGLTLSRQIVAAHHGSLHLRNLAQDEGCIAEVSLPLSLGEEMKPASP